MNRQFKAKLSLISRQFGLDFTSRGSWFGKLLGTEFRKAGGNPLLRGIYRNHPLTLTTVDTGSREVYGSAFIMRVGIAKPYINEMSISRKGILDKVGAKLGMGMKDIQINPLYLGEQNYFDKNFIVHGDDEDKIRKILDKDIQEKIQRANTLEMRVDFDSACIAQEYMVLQFDEVRFKSAIDVAIEVVEKIESLGDKDIPYGIPVED